MSCAVTAVKRESVMQIALHKNARTTPAVRAEIAASDESARTLAARRGITDADRLQEEETGERARPLPPAHRLQPQLAPAQEVVVVHLRIAAAAR